MKRKGVNSEWRDVGKVRGRKGEKRGNMRGRKGTGKGKKGKKGIKMWFKSKVQMREHVNCKGGTVGKVRGRKWERLGKVRGRRGKGRVIEGKKGITMWLKG